MAQLYNIYWSEKENISVCKVSIELCFHEPEFYQVFSTKISGNLIDFISYQGYNCIK